jgi:UDP-glucuronate decarboxylase
MRRVVVSGAAGFLGSHLCRALLARGDEVVAIDNLLTGRLDNIEELFGRPEFTFQNMNVSDYVHVSGQVDAVLHFASPASPVDYLEHPIPTLKVGSVGTFHLLGLAKDKGAKFFLASTSEVYGDPVVHPQTEDYWGNVNPIGPRGVYDEAKRFAEAMTMAYHRSHGLDVRIVRIFNSILADEQVLYDDGRELRRERAQDVAVRLQGRVDLSGWRVPAFGADGAIDAVETTAFVGHPTTSQCFDVQTRYGRSVRVTGDHSLFVLGRDGEPEARRVSELRIGDRVAIAGRVQVPERDRVLVAMAEVCDAVGIDPWSVVVSHHTLGRAAWDNREVLFAAWQDAWPATGKTWRSQVWSRIHRARKYEAIPLGGMRKLGIPVPGAGVIKLRTSGATAELPTLIDLTDEVLWLLGLYAAEGCRYEKAKKSAFITISCEEDVLDRAEKVIRTEFNLHVVRSRPSAERSGALFVHSQLLLAFMDFLGFGFEKRIPGWILGLPLSRLKWFIEGYREGDGVHSGLKFDEGIRHEFSTTSEALKDDLIVAFARFGLVPSVGKYSSQIKQKTGDRKYPFWRLTLPRVTPWSPLSWDQGVTQTLQSRKTGDIVWAAVKAITPIESTALVYDFCVPGRENFWAGTGVMCHNTYGERMRPNDGRVVSNFIVQALQGKPITVYGDGSQTRSFCYVEDEVRGLLGLLDSDYVGPVNIGNPDEFTIRELADIVIDVTGSSSEVIFEPLPIDDPTQRKPNIDLAKSLFGWEPKIPLREGLQRTVPWFKKVLEERGG